MDTHHAQSDQPEKIDVNELSQKMRVCRKTPKTEKHTDQQETQVQKDKVHEHVKRPGVPGGSRHSLIKIGYKANLRHAPQGPRLEKK
jgi:hypothetical protein